MKSKVRCYAVAICCLLLSVDAFAVSIFGRTTDDSVCDLSPFTSYRLASKTFVEEGTRNSDEIYTRLALRFITTACKNNQTLILDSRYGKDFDMRYFRTISNQLCAIADVQRIANGTSENPNAFQIKCRIVKMENATKWLKEAEASKSTETLISEGAPTRSGNSSSSGSSGAPTSTREDCNKLTYTSIFIGGGGCR